MSAVISESEECYRSMKVDDLDAVMGIESNAYTYPWSRAIFRDCINANYHCCVMEIDNIIVGYAVFIVAVGECHILNICINPELQGKGLGRKLLSAVLEFAKDSQAKCIFLEVRPSNRHAISLYNSEGFNEVGVRKKYYPAKHGREDAVILAKEL
ncbi:MAG: ribosomal protein S18-alanine N-acetyltransferase [Pseudomonadota bacterium]